MHVAGLQTEPVHRGEMSDRIARVGVLDELRLRGRSGREVEKERVVRCGGAVRRERAACGHEVVVAQPPVERIAHGDPCECTADAREAACQLRLRDDMGNAAAFDPVDDVGGRQERARGNDHRTQLGQREEALPERRAVAEHEQGAVTTAHTLVTQPARQRGGSRAQLGKRTPRLAVVIDDPETGAVIARGDDVEPVERPVEVCRTWPAEIAVCGLVVVPVREQEVAGHLEFHACALLVVRSGTP